MFCVMGVYVTGPCFSSSLCHAPYVQLSIDQSVQECDATMFHIYSIDWFIKHLRIGTSAYHSVLKLFTGFAIAALIAWKLIVIEAIATAAIPAITNIHHDIVTLYA